MPLARLQEDTILQWRGLTIQASYYRIRSRTVIAMNLIHVGKLVLTKVNKDEDLAGDRYRFYCGIPINERNVYPVVPRFPETVRVCAVNESIPLVSCEATNLDVGKRLPW
jgi:hypothetical protein